jgi:hypothetical protein
MAIDPFMLTRSFLSPILCKAVQSLDAPDEIPDVFQAEWLQQTVEGAMSEGEQRGIEVDVP